MKINTNMKVHHCEPKIDKVATPEFDLDENQLKNHLSNRIKQLGPKLNELSQKQTQLLEKINQIETFLSKRIAKKEVPDCEIQHLQTQKEKILKYKTQINGKELEIWKTQLNQHAVESQDAPLNEREKVEARLLANLIQVESWLRNIENKSSYHFQSEIGIKEAPLLIKIRKVENWLFKFELKRTLLDKIEQKIKKGEPDKWLSETQPEIKKYFYGSSITSLIIGLGSLGLISFLKCPCSTNAKQLMGIGVVGVASSIFSCAVSIFWCTRITPADQRAAYRYTFLCTSAMAMSALLVNIATIALANPMCEYLDC